MKEHKHKKNKMFQRKKAQITIFIIIGILLIAGASFLIYSQIKRAQDRPIVGPPVEDIPLEAAPINKFVTDCLKEISIKAIKKAGEHGGYVEPLNEEAAGRNFVVDFFSPTKAEGVLFDSSFNYFIPYWYYLKDEPTCFNCEIDSAGQEIVDIENQISYYIKNNLNDCLNDFDEIIKTGFEMKSVGKMEVFTQINEKDVGVLVKYPVKFSNLGHELSLDSFYISADVNLKKTVELAWIITLTQSNYNSLEYITKNLLSTYSGLDYALLPPMSRVDTSPMEFSWDIGLAKQKVEGILSNHIQLITVNNTKNFARVDIRGLSEDQKAIYSPFMMAFDVINVSRYNNLDVNFIYGNWPIFLDITPKEGNLVRGYKTTQNFPMGIIPPESHYSYEFFYDLAYPVVVTIRDDSAFVNEQSPGFTFSFALEGNLKKNKDLSEWLMGEGTIPSWDYSQVRVNLQEGAPTTYQDNENITRSIRNASKTLFCDKTQRISGEILIHTLSRLDGTPLDGVKVTFGCGDYQECEIGQTATNSDQQGELKSSFPICIGSGYLVFEKDGYQKTSKLDVSIRPEEAKDLGVIYIEPIKEMNLSLSTVMLSNISAKINFTVNQTILFNLRKIDSRPLEDNLNQFVMFGPENNFTSRIELVPGEYEVEGKIMDSSGVIIEKECKHICKIRPDWCDIFCENEFDLEIVSRKGGDVGHAYRVAALLSGGGFFGFGMFGCSLSEECVKSTIQDYCMDVAEVMYDERIPDSDIEINPASIGGLVFNNETGYFTVSKQKLNMFDNIEMVALQMEPPICIDELEEQGKLNQYYLQYINDFYPRFS